MALTHRGRGLLVTAKVFFATYAIANALKSSRILGERSAEQAHSQARAGDGAGRPLYNFDEITLPEPDEGNKSCLAVKMDIATTSLIINAFPASMSEYVPSDGIFPDAIAWGCFENKLAVSGWNHLSLTVTDDDKYSLAVRAFSAGVAEGCLTSRQIIAFSNTVKGLLQKDIRTDVKCNSVGCGTHFAVERVLRTALIAWEELSGGDANIQPNDTIREQAWVSLLHMRGIRDGYNVCTEERSEGDPPISMYDLTLMNMHAELPAVLELFSRSEESKSQTALLQVGSRTFQKTSLKSTTGGWERWASHQQSGSAIVRRLGPMGTPTDMLAAQSAFGNYGEMLRIMKVLKFKLGRQAMDTITMSSYPGCLSSTDDYMITGGNLVLMSTNLWMPSRGDYAKPARTNDGLPNFVRAITATKVATQPRLWAQIYGSLVGIAGGKQWLIADYNMFKHEQPIINGTVFLVESLPRLTRFLDVSESLAENGFVQVTGTPHFRQFRQIFGMSAFDGSYEEHLQNALLDKADTISSIEMAHQVFSEIVPARTSAGSGIEQVPVVTRHDQDRERPIPEGSIDAKVTTSSMVADGTMHARSGPPSGEGMEHWNWERSSWPDWPRHGLPAQWNFSWVQIRECGITSLLGECRREAI